MDVPDSSHVVQLVIQAAKRMGLDVKTMASGGGCDANVFNRKGIECANLGTGMRAIHTVKEWLDVKDMYAAAETTLEIMKLNGQLAQKTAEARAKVRGHSLMRETKGQPSSETRPPVE